MGLAARLCQICRRCSYPTSVALAGGWLGEEQENNSWCKVAHDGFTQSTSFQGVKVQP
jgi:hypothetical protein